MTRAPNCHYPILKFPFHSPVFVGLKIRPVSQLTYLLPIFPPLTHNSDSSPISKFIWNTSTLLLLSNDVEINPGPRPVDQNPVFCCICSNKINRGIQHDTAPTCSVENCNAQCHQVCNGLSIHQTRHAKNSGRSITCKCSQHSTGTAEITAPPPSIYEIPSRPSVVGKSCSVCKSPIQARYADLAYIARFLPVIMFVILQLRAVGLLIPEVPQEPALFPFESGTVIYTPYCQQVHIQQGNQIPHLNVPHRHRWSLSWIKACL